MGCFVHVILLGVGCFVSLQKNMWWFSSTYNKMDVGGYVRGVFCPYTHSDNATEFFLMCGLQKKKKKKKKKTMEVWAAKKKNKQKNKKKKPTS